MWKKKPEAVARAKGVDEIRTTEFSRLVTAFDMKPDHLRTYERLAVREALALWRDRQPPDVTAVVRDIEPHDVGVREGWLVGGQPGTGPVMDLTLPDQVLTAVLGIEVDPADAVRASWVRLRLNGTAIQKGIVYLSPPAVVESRGCRTAYYWPSGRYFYSLSSRSTSSKDGSARRLS